MSSVKELEKNKVEIEFEVQEDAIREAELRAYNKNKGRYNVPGFRKGHAPKAVIEKFYGNGVFFEEALQSCLSPAFDAAVEELGVVAVSRAENVQLKSENNDMPMVFTAEVYTKPEVTLGEYKGLTVEVKPAESAKKYVDEEIKKILEQHARYVDVDRAAELGDKTVIDFVGTIDGVPFEGGSSEGEQLDIGSHMFIEGFEEQVIGMKAGEEKDINVTFPENYHAAELAGKPAVFHVKLNAVKAKEMPELDDEFAQDISEFETLEEYMNDIESTQQKRIEREHRFEIEDAVITAIIDNAEVEIPACMIDDQVEYQLTEMQYNMSAQGLDFSTYLKYTGTTEAEIREKLRVTAEDRVKTRLVMEQVKLANPVEATQEDIDEELDIIADQQGLTLDEYKKGLDDDNIEYIKQRAAYSKLIKELVDSATIVEKEPEEAPAEAEESQPEAE